MRCSRRQLVSFALVLVAYVWCAAQYDDITLAVVAAVHLAASLALGSAARRLPRYLVVSHVALAVTIFGYLLLNLISPADEIGPIYKSGMGKDKRAEMRAKERADKVAAFVAAAAALGALSLALVPSEIYRSEKDWCRGCMLPVFLKSQPEFAKALAAATKPTSAERR